MNTPPPTGESNVGEEVSGPSLLGFPLQQESDSCGAIDSSEDSEASYRYLFESNPHPMWIFDAETLRFLLVNDAAIEHYGFSRDEFLAMTIKDIRPEEDIPLLLATMSDSPNRGKPAIWRHKRKDGRIIDVEIVAHDFRFRGKPARLALVDDITDRRRAEQALHQSEQQHRKLVEHLEQERERLAEAQAVAKVGSWELDLATNVLFWSDETYRIFGIDRADFGASYEAFLERVHPDDRDAVNRAYAEAIANCTLYAIDHRMQMADGSIKYVHERCHTTYDAAGRPLRSIGTVQDVTEQKQTEYKLTHSLNLLRAITEGTTDAIYAKDMQGRYLMINTAGANFVGKTPTEIIGHDDTALFMPGDASRTMAIDRRVRESGETLSVESPAQAARVQRIYQSTKGPLRDHTGQIIGVFGVSRDITERKQSELTLQHIMEGAHCLLWEAEVEDMGGDLHWNVKMASDEAAQRFLPLDVTTEQGYNHAWYVARPVEDIVRMDLYSGREIRAGRSYQQEFRIHSQDGTLHWLAENVHVETLGEGRWRCVGVCTDITERKLAEETTRAMTHGAQCLLWYAFVENQSHGLQWDIETPDEEAAQQFFPVVQTPGQSYTEAWARSRVPEESPIIDARGAEALLSGQAGYTQQFRCRRADGEWRWLNETVHIEALTPGRWHCVGVCTDVTEQKRAEEERDRFFTLSLDLLGVADLNGYFTRLNPAFETVLGFTQAELMERPFLDFVHPDDREATIAVSAQLVVGHATRDFENRYRCRDGSYRWLTWTAIAYEGHLYAAAHDITPIKEAKAALHKANEELEARVEQRTAQIMEANAQLVAAKQEADHANRAKSEFLSRMSHELRTPLNAILGFGQILDKQALTPLQEESVQYILKGGRHLLDLINEVLDIARVEAGHIDLSLEPIALADVVSESCAFIRSLAATHQVFLDESAAALERRHVLADRQRLKQVLLNLLSNAVKYNRPGGQVSVHCLPGPNDCLRIAVQDTGPGITLEEQRRLFTPFERLNAAQSGIEGTGLGLVMAQRLVTAMGGHLTLESVPGEGTCCFIDLALVPSPEQTFAEQTRRGGFETEPNRFGERCATVLTIEDNLSNLRLMEVVLRSRPGITLLPAMQGSVGLDLARQHKPDLILLDINLPDISGREVLARLQASALTRDIPVIVLSADATASQIERLLSAGAKAYLTKPLDVTEFLKTLDRLLPEKNADTLPAEEQRN
jgi:PAS domain S-box-containing protein